MKKLTVIAAACVVSVSMTASAAPAAEKDKKKHEIAQQQQPALTDQQRADISAAAVQKLTGQKWTIYLYVSGSRVSSYETDTLTFAGGGVSSDNLTLKQFSGSNYSLSVQDDGAAVWETVQRNPDNDIAMWRGELRGEMLVGTMTLRSQGVTKSYNFSTAMPRIEHQAITEKPAAAKRAATHAVAETKK